MTRKEDQMPGATTLDRIIVLAVSTLIALFTFGTVSALVTTSVADDASGMRDDDARELVAQDEDDDDGDGPNARDGSRDGSRSRGDSRDSESNSRTGTTRGTGPSHSKSNSR
jgi:hypothetical protein